MKVKVIRALAENIEKEMQDFFDTLPIPSQIIEIKTGGDWVNHHLAIVIITYLNYAPQTPK